LVEHAETQSWLFHGSAFAEIEVEIRGKLRLIEIS
jgi:hypothetical protein